MKTISLVVFVIAGMTGALPAQRTVDTSFVRRAQELVRQMTLAEKVSQMQDVAAPIDRLGVPGYNWWNEALHGVARSGLATVFPQAIGLAATWDDSLMHRVATVISDEARAKNNDYLRQGSRRRYQGLTFWSPNINLFRDPRWGRGQETYGEDPFLTGRMAVQFIRGMQGDDPRYLKTVSTVKHFAVHSGPEPTRHEFNAEPSERDLRESYLPQFRAGIEQGGAFSLMCAYNRVDDHPACGSSMLLHDILRGEWGFHGYVVSDCGAIDDIYQGHKVATGATQAAVVGVTAGTDLECGSTYHHLVDAVQSGQLAESVLDTSVIRLFTARMALGMFDSSASVPWSSLTIADVDRPAQRALAREVARKSMVLLKNAHHLLPLRKDMKNIAVIGPNADDPTLLLGNYNGTPADPITPLRGIREAVSRETRVTYARGARLAEELPGNDSTSSAALDAEALRVARSADVVILVLGLSNALEGEEMRVHVPGFSGGDRTSLDLPASQEMLMQHVVALGKPTVLVLLNGSAVAVNWADAHVPAILEAWYPGQAGGAALADVLFGDTSPGGRLPVTFYHSVLELPAFDDYKMAGRTYRFFPGKPLYPFGFGLSYTSFRYEQLHVDRQAYGPDDTIRATFNLRNSGKVAGDEVAQLYVRQLGATVTHAARDLRDYRRMTLAPGEQRVVTFAVPVRSLMYWNVAQHGWAIDDEAAEIEIGASSSDIRLRQRVGLHR